MALASAKSSLPGTEIEIASKIPEDAPLPQPRLLSSTSMSQFDVVGVRNLDRSMKTAEHAFVPSTELDPLSTPLPSRVLRPVINAAALMRCAAEGQQSDNELAIDVTTPAHVHDDGPPSDTQLFSNDDPAGHSQSSVQDEPTPSNQPILENNAYNSIRLLTASGIPNADPDHPQAKTWRTWKSRRDIALASNLGIACTVFSINFVAAIIGWTKYPLADGIVNLYQGDCGRVKWGNTGIHILINVLSTLLLGASSATLQLVASPTRSQIAAAHMKGVWLDIGVPSIRNLKWISKSSVAVWWLLALTSIPIHFLYNATVFSTVTINNYASITVSGSFLALPNILGTRNISSNENYYIIESLRNSNSTNSDFVTYTWNGYHANSTLYRNLTAEECVQAYNDPFVWRPNLILVSSDDASGKFSLEKTLLSGVVTYESSEDLKTLCDSTGIVDRNCSSLVEASTNISNPFYFPAENHTKRYLINYCLNRAGETGEAEASACHLQFSPQIISIIAVFNLIKCLCILWVIFAEHEPTICTIGDAVASFLEFPDPWTKNLGICSRDDIVNSKGTWRSSKAGSVPWRPQGSRWWYAASRRRWVFTIITSTSLVLAGTVVMTRGLLVEIRYKRSISWGTLWSYGFGIANSNRLIQWGQPTQGQLGLLVNILLANIWQVLMSFLYIGYSFLLTCLLMADEWQRFGQTRKTLRVTSPRGIQRSSYFISMPWTYGIPMMAFSFIEHWLLSQATFILRIIQLNWDGSPYNTWTITGYSLMPCILAPIFFALCFLAQLLNGLFRHFPAENSMPLVSTCSVAISAACHRPEGDKEAHLLPVQWGVAGRNELGVECCSFTTSRDVKPPDPGKEYTTMSSVSRHVGRKDWNPLWWRSRLGMRGKRGV